MTISSGHQILYVHGRDFKPAGETLLDLSEAATRSGVERDYPDGFGAFNAIEKDIAYYGDLTNSYLLAQGQHYDEDLDVGDRRNALAELRAISMRKRFNIRQYDRLPGKTAIPEFIADVAAPVLGVIGLSMPLMSSVSKDFAAYLRNSDNYADKVRARVRQKICEQMGGEKRLMIISHGTGSVVAYDVLWQLSHDSAFQKNYEKCKVDSWVTLGSPLGDANVRKRLLGASEKTIARFPTNVISWCNVAAEDDYVCHDNTLADDFKKMMSERIVSAVRDYHIFNHAVRYGRSNPHSSLGYYIHPRIAKIIMDWLAADGSEQAPKYTL